MTDLEGKVAVITGASKGIGREIAVQFAAAGATVIVNYSGSEQAALETVDEIKKNGGLAQAYRCDVTDFEAVATMISDVVRDHRKIDILVNNAGITKDGLLMKMTQDDFNRVLDVNLKGTFHCIRHVSRQMLKQRAGRIINMSSVVGIAGNAGQANYAASKAGIIGLTKSAAKELASRGITVNAIAPGYIDTDMTKVLSDSVKEKVLEAVPLGRMGTVSDIANLAIFLASDQSAYITGQIISIDGGMNI